MITTRSAVLCGSRARCNTAHIVARKQARAACHRKRELPDAPGRLPSDLLDEFRSSRPPAVASREGAATGRTGRKVLMLLGRLNR